MKIKTISKHISIVLFLMVLTALILPAHTVEATGWLGTWAHRRALVINETYVDAVLTDYPILINLSATSGIGDVDVTSVFDELGANSLKIAVTTDDGTTECYVEVVSWDSTNETAELWTKVPTVSNVTDTTIYLYYDVTQADNVGFVGATGSVPAIAVWDANFVAVYHMNDTTTSNITGSTVLNAAGVKKGANEPVEAAGGVGKAQNFDGTDDIVTITDSASLSSLGPLTVESYFSQDIQGAEGLIVKQGNGDVGTLEWSFVINSSANGALRLALYSSAAGNFLYATGNTDLSDATYHYGAGVWDGVNLVSHITIYADGIADTLLLDNKTGTGYTPYDTNKPVEIGRLLQDNTYCFDGKISEARISKIARPPAYIKATNYTLTDTIVTFGAEENIVIAPTITISAATAVSYTTATLNGNLTATGGENSNITVYWGEADGGTTPASWANNSIPTSPAQPQGVGVFYLDATGLSEGTLYYFSAKATNSAGTDWPPASLSFTTSVSPAPGIAVSQGYLLSSFATAKISNYHVEITWDAQPGATTYMVRSSLVSYPTFSTQGVLVYLGTDTTCVDHNISAQRTKYCVFYKDANGTWILAYPKVRFAKT